MGSEMCIRDSFHAAELQREPNEANLARTDLQAMLTALAPSWMEQLDRRGIALELDLAVDLPAILSDSRRLEPMLGGLIDRSTRGLPPAVSSHFICKQRERG